MLPPFQTLASDEEREKKAQSSVPGTYHVICVPESFSDLPEYAEHEPDEPKGLSSSPDPRSGSNRLATDVSEVNDPNIVILRSFRDARGNPYLSPRHSPRSPNSDLRESSLSSVSAYTTVPEFTEEDRPFPLQPHEIFLLDHFRTAVWRNIIPRAGIFESPSGYEINSDDFEQEAAKFPPVSGPSPDLRGTFFPGVEMKRGEVLITAIASLCHDCSVFTQSLSPRGGPAYRPVIVLSTSIFFVTS